MYSYIIPQLNRETLALDYYYYMVIFDQLFNEWNE